MTVVQFGAGNIGRGFVGQLWSEAGYEVVFVEQQVDLVARLNERRAYRLRLAGPDRRETLTIAPVRAVAVAAREQVIDELARAAFACTAVGVAALSEVAPLLAAAAARRRQERTQPLAVFLCENELACAERVRAALRPHLAAERDGDYLVLIESVVHRTVPPVSAEERAADPLLVVAEDWPTLVADAQAGAPLPIVPGVEYVRDFRGHFERKLYVHNMAHAVVAYLGYAAGYRTIDAAMADPEIARTARAAMAEASEALRRKYGWRRAEIKPWIASLERRFGNPELADTVERVGRDPLRKLRPADRLIGAASLCLAHGVVPQAIVRGIAAALRFDPPGDRAAAELQAALRCDGIERFLADWCRLPPGSDLARSIEAAAAEIGIGDGNASPA